MEVGFALSALHVRILFLYFILTFVQEIPEQYQAIRQLGLLENWR